MIAKKDMTALLKKAATFLVLLLCFTILEGTAFLIGAHTARDKPAPPVAVTVNPDKELAKKLDQLLQLVSKGQLTGHTVLPGHQAGTGGGSSGTPAQAGTITSPGSTGTTAEAQPGLHPGDRVTMQVSGDVTTAVTDKNGQNLGQGTSAWTGQLTLWIDPADPSHLYATVDLDGPVTIGLDIKDRSPPIWRVEGGWGTDSGWFLNLEWDLNLVVKDTWLMYLKTQATFTQKDDLNFRASVVYAWN